jgi:hypothetical protein
MRKQLESENEVLTDIEVFEKSVCEGVNLLSNQWCEDAHRVGGGYFRVGLGRESW